MSCFPVSVEGVVSVREEIAYDVEEFPERIFRLELPGVEFRRFDVPDYGRP